MIRRCNISTAVKCILIQLLLSLLLFIAFHYVADDHKLSKLNVTVDSQPLKSNHYATDTNTTNASYITATVTSNPKAGVLESTVTSLRNLPFHSLDLTVSIDDVILQLSKHEKCTDMPVIISMASVKNKLYWQLIENFIYGLLKFDALSCALMICVSDLQCMKECNDYMFPCYYYDHIATTGITVLPSVMEQIATLKLHHIPRVLDKGVDIFILDLDVGFLSNPMGLFNPNVANRIEQKIDMYVQRDVMFVMNRTLIGWKTWYTEPLPNIGLMLSYGTPRTSKMYESAWSDYTKIEKTDIKRNPGKDQNKVVDAMRREHHRSGLNWRYFDKTVLLDKVYKFQTKTIDLGGPISADILKDTIAVHATCYEQKSKILGLKAANAFWNPYYYNPDRRTLTVKLMYTTYDNLHSELKALVYLSLKTNRTLIIPSLLGDRDIYYDHKKAAGKPGEVKRIVDLYKDKALWPSFRVLFVNEKAPLDVHVVEPAYYRRITNDYNGKVPSPHVVLVDDSEKRSLVSILTKLTSIKANAEATRLVLAYEYKGGHDVDVMNEMIDFAVDATGGADTYGSYPVEMQKYLALPPIQGADAQLIRLLSEYIRPCRGIFEIDRGNRSCFDKCK